MRKMLFLTTSLVLLACNGEDTTTEAQIDFTANAKQLVLEEFQPSTLNQKEQLEELSWFTNAAEPFRGMTINVVSETLTTHEYESEVLTKAFYEITGINVNHDLIQEGDVIEKLQTQMQNMYFLLKLITHI